jgi:hypothetical protein
MASHGSAKPATRKFKAGHRGIIPVITSGAGPKGRVPTLRCWPEHRYTYERKIAQRFGDQQEFEFPAAPPKTELVPDGSPGPLFDHAEKNEAAN